VTPSPSAPGARLTANLGLTERVLAGPRMRKLLTVVEDGLDRVEDTLARELRVSDQLADATTRYLYEAGGKRVRPMLTLLTAQLGAGTTDFVVAGATALEMTHLGSLPLEGRAQADHYFWCSVVVVGLSCRTWICTRNAIAFCYR
jgi:heptaprenyl diphosphate synthase